MIDLKFIDVQEYFHNGMLLYIKNSDDKVVWLFSPDFKARTFRGFEDYENTRINQFCDFLSSKKEMCFELKKSLFMQTIHHLILGKFFGFKVERPIKGVHPY